MIPSVSISSPSSSLEMLPPPSLFGEESTNQTPAPIQQEQTQLTLSTRLKISLNSASSASVRLDIVEEPGAKFERPKQGGQVLFLASPSLSPFHTQMPSGSTKASEGSSERPEGAEKEGAGRAVTRGELLCYAHYQVACLLLFSFCLPLDRPGSGSFLSDHNRTPGHRSAGEVAEEARARSDSYLSVPLVAASRLTPCVDDDHQLLPGTTVVGTDHRRGDGVLET